MAGRVTQVLKCLPGPKFKLQYWGKKKREVKLNELPSNIGDQKMSDSMNLVLATW
jgi:hypothetical protein